MPRYNPAVIEPKWQKYWEKNRTFACPRLPKGRKLYVLDMFPYPSGDGLHVGHPEGYTATDIVCRYNRMKGVSVMHPMGWDAFGLPAEQHAKKTGTPPRETTEKNIANFRRQLRMLGFSYDWDRELATTDLNYFRWTQWIFLVLYDTWFDQSEQRGRPIAELPIPEEVEAEGEAAPERYRDEHRLAYQIEAPVNWCPALGTVLANEEVVGGVSERGGHMVVRTKLRQWMLRITAYADRLEKDLDRLDWSEGIKLLQRNWIGRSTGAEVDFFIGDRLPLAVSQQEEYEAWKRRRSKTGFPKKPGNDMLRIYTTRADTLFGATYMVLAPEHPFVERLTAPEQREAVRAYCEQAARKSDLDRTDLAKEKTGVWTGSYAVNPVNGESIPIWVADYVLISYGTGAIMAVPAHDTRDFEFAEQFDLPIRAVLKASRRYFGWGYVDVRPLSEWHRQQESGEICFTGDESKIRICQSEVELLDPSISINSGPYNDLPTAEFKRKIAEDLAAQGIGRAAVNYKLRDWLFSRQHFWGEPFPLLHELDDDGRPTGRVRALAPSELPLDLPAEMAFDADHDRPEPPLDKAPDDWLYVTIDGRRYKRETNTMPQWAGSCWYYLRFLDPKNARALVDPQVEKAWMPVDLYVGGAEHAVLHLLYARFWHKVLFDRGHVGGDEPFQKLVNQGMILGENGEKMSKSRGNAVNPDEVVREYGADSLRLFEMFMGPLEAVKPWSMDGVSGVRGFLDRVWRMIVDERAETMQLNPAVQVVKPSAEQNRVLHKTIKAVTADLDRMSFNTAISRMMEFTNFFLKQEPRPRAAMEKLVLLLSPFAPHAAEELWAALGHDESLAFPPWPEFDEAAIKEDTIEVPVQIGGKLRGRIQVPAEADKAALESAARAEPKIAELLAGKTVVKAIVVPGRMVNFVVK
ncbi:MAG: leucine--tRNA ligase [Planctomycetes bacterium]|nr:leucine--tRNA ligase [Planctomycetota bacterium]MBU4397838.1 leucine--tRNA ligase [Planctomycetota bacterium]MCG2683435.1 leucine--tRNA ligase [Planctomycetales bacterium]